MNPLVSIVVPVYNAEKYILSCVCALKAQEYSNIEIILVNDGSTDESPKMCDSLAESDCRICVIHKSRGGVSSARNRGIEAAKGHYLMFADSDDMYEKNMVNRMVLLAEQWKVNFVICGYRIVKTCIEAKTPINNSEPFQPVWAMSKEELWDGLGYMMGFGINIFAPWNKLFVLDVIKRNKLMFPEHISYGEDLIFNINYIQFCNGVIETREKLYNYIVQNPESLEAQYKPDLFESHAYLYHSAKQFMIDNSVYKDFNVYNLCYYYAKRILHCIIMQGQKENQKNEFEKRKYVESFFESPDVLEAISIANLHDTEKESLFTDLVKAKRYGAVYDLILNESEGRNKNSNYIRYKVMPEEGTGVKWILITFKSLKKYGVVITAKRVLGKIKRKLWR